MTIRIAVMAAVVATFALAQVNLAQAADAVAGQPKTANGNSPKHKATQTSDLRTNGSKTTKDATNLRPANKPVQQYNPKELGVDKSVPWQRRKQG